MVRNSQAWDVLQACLPHPGQLRVLTLRNVDFPFDHWNDSQREFLSGREALTLHDAWICFREKAPESSGNVYYLSGHGGVDPDQPRWNSAVCTGKI